MNIAVKEDTSCYASDKQRQALGLLSRIDELSHEFFLTGGTALSVFYLHHRSSEDIDFFSTTFRNLSSIDEKVRRVFAHDVTLIQSSLDFYSDLIRDVRLFLRSFAAPHDLEAIIDAGDTRLRQFQVPLPIPFPRSRGDVVVAQEFYEVPFGKPRQLG